MTVTTAGATGATEASLAEAVILGPVPGAHPGLPARFIDTLRGLNQPGNQW
jgi:hypothetical protein